MEKHTVTVRGVTFGSGLPKICVPLVAADPDELEAALISIRGLPWDLLEFRADCFHKISPDALGGALALIRESVGEVPVLFTLRTAAEGGRADVTYGEYEELLVETAKKHTADLIDVELLTAGAHAAQLTDALHACGALVLGSSHDFEKTPPVEEMTARLTAMQDAGMDMTKLAVMPRSRLDVLALLSADAQMEEQLADRPHVTMSMGSVGQISRLTGAFTGSAFTFASAGKSSAPGQMDVVRVKEILTQMGDIASHADGQKRK